MNLYFIKQYHPKQQQRSGNAAKRLAKHSGTNGLNGFVFFFLNTYSSKASTFFFLNSFQDYRRGRDDKGARSEAERFPVSKTDDKKTL